MNGEKVHLVVWDVWDTTRPVLAAPLGLGYRNDWNVVALSATQIAVSFGKFTSILHMSYAEARSLLASIHFSLR